MSELTFEADPSSHTFSYDEPGVESEVRAVGSGGKPLTYHGACGKSWLQVGNRTSHCGGCHLTFSSLRSFDIHQQMKDGRSICLPPLATKPPLVARADSRTGEPIWGQEGTPPVVARGGSDEAEEG